MPQKHSAVLDAGEFVVGALEEQTMAAMDWYTAFLHSVEAGTLPAGLANEPFLQDVPLGRIRHVVCEWRDRNQEWIGIATAATEKCRRLGPEQMQEDSLMRYCAAVTIRESGLREYLAHCLGEASE